MPLLDQAGDDDWTSGLFDCFTDVTGCLDSVLCCSCQLGRQCSSLSGSQNKQDVKMAVISTILFCGFPCYVFSVRRSLRQQFGIAGGTGSDCVGATICGCCGHCQHQRELTNRGYWPGGSCFADKPPGGIG